MTLNSKEILSMLECDNASCKILEHTPDTQILSIARHVYARSKYSHHRKKRLLYWMEISFTPPYPLPINTPEDLSISHLLELTYKPYKHNQHTIPMIMAAISYYLDSNNQDSTINNIEDILTITNDQITTRKNLFEQNTKFYISNQAIELLKQTSKPSTSLMKTIRKILLTLQLRQHLRASQNPDQTEQPYNPLHNSFSAHMFYKDIVHTNAIKKLEIKTQDHSILRKVTAAIKGHQPEAEFDLQQLVDINKKRLQEDFPLQCKDLGQKSISLQIIKETCQNDDLMTTLEKIIMPTLVIDMKVMSAYNALSETLQHVRSLVTENTMLQRASSYFRGAPPHKQATPDSSPLDTSITIRTPRRYIAKASSKIVNQQTIMDMVIGFFIDLWSTIITTISKYSENDHKHHSRPISTTTNIQNPISSEDEELNEELDEEIKSTLQQTTSKPGADMDVETKQIKK